ncbi:MAG: UDP-2,3-diacylglucosamine diphosphatase LpxI [Sneathiellales bacterium]|nr:UDP-2,3-diacylglucosamine diphosphatase LpxI [Sneathiellales bacterium]
MASVNLNSEEEGRVGIIAGRGDLPLKLANTLQNRGEAPYLLLVKGEADPVQYSEFPHDIIPITKIGRFLKILRRENCKRVTLIGPVARPDFKNILPDMEGLKLLGRITSAASKGDDGLMRAITEFVEERGFQIVGAHELELDLLSTRGVLGKVQPSEDDFKDIDKGSDVIATLGRFDIGQAVIVRDQYVLGIEAAEGTEELVKRCAAFKWDYAAGTLVKRSKPGQDLRADMPTIGVDTVKQAFESGLRGIAIEAGRSQIVDRDLTIQIADKLGLFIYGCDSTKQS